MAAPSWTDFNRHDPGVTLLALFAWLAVGLLLARRLGLLRSRRACGVELRRASQQRG